MVTEAPDPGQPEEELEQEKCICCGEMTDAEDLEDGMCEDCRDALKGEENEPVS